MMNKAVTAPKVKAMCQGHTAKRDTLPPLPGMMMTMIVMTMMMMMMQHEEQKVRTSPVALWFGHATSARTPQVDRIRASAAG